ncbi:Caffeoylshikimate esterase [Vitis vinifera]|uniref:Caffeoylshikimate esterase n=1 Tax=Vitis vinifera TaxID=29760 RepID=A0A438K875_VITVI|nr:Caffeoylshikimate esterase [Vitis vinifera]
MESVQMEELTSGASGRIIPVFRNLRRSVLSWQSFRRSLIFIHSIFLWLILLLPRHRLSSSAQSPPAPVKSCRRRSVFRRDEEDTLKRRALAEGLEMVTESEDGTSLCRCATSLFYGTRRNALFCRSWFPVAGEMKELWASYLVSLHFKQGYGSQFWESSSRVEECHLPALENIHRNFLSGGSSDVFNCHSEKLFLVYSLQKLWVRGIMIIIHGLNEHRSPKFYYYPISHNCSICHHYCYAISTLTTTSSVATTMLLLLPSSLATTCYLFPITTSTSTIASNIANTIVKASTVASLPSPPPSLSIPPSFGRYADFAKQLTSCSFGVYAMDWIGHGGSDGLHGYVPSLDHVVADTGAFLEKIKSENPGIPCFLFGHSTGGAVVLKAASYPEIEGILEGIVLTSPALRVKPAHPIVGAVAPIFSLVVPRYQFKGANKRGIPVSRDPAAMLAKYSDPLVYTGPIRVRTGHEILRISSYLTRNFKSVTVPFLVLHGTADRVTDPLASQDLYTEAASRCKNIKLYDGFLHDLLFEPEREEIAQDIIDWMEKRLCGHDFENVHSHW